MVLDGTGCLLQGGCCLLGQAQEEASCPCCSHCFCLLHQLLPGHCDAASQVPQHHQIAIDFLAGWLSRRQESCSLAWLRAAKRRKAAKCHLKTPGARLTPRTPKSKQSGHAAWLFYGSVPTTPGTKIGEEGMQGRRATPSRGLGPCPRGVLPSPARGSGFLSPPCRGCAAPGQRLLL